MTDSGSYTFDKIDGELPEGTTFTIWPQITTNDMDLPEDLKPVDEETLLQDKLKFLIDKGSELKTQLEEAVQKVKFYEKAIKSYNKAFKK